MIWFTNLSTAFVVGYPIFVSIIWISGCLFSAMLRRHHPRPLLAAHQEPFVSILVPAHNETATLREAVQSLAGLDYQQYEIILIDDCSDDQTLRLMYDLQAEWKTTLSIKVVSLPVNQGKANALNPGLVAAQGDYLIAIDADSLLAPDAVNQLMATLMGNPQYGAVTGKPVVRNRSNLLGRLQLLEYVGVIDLIKQAQAYLTGNITTVSGVIVAFRRTALTCRS